PSHYFLGIDGGGTKTVFRLVDKNEIVRREIYKGSSNPNDIGMEHTLYLLKKGIQEICGDIPYEKITLFAGISGGGLTGGNSDVLHRFFHTFGFFAFDNGSDIENLILLANRNPCILVIMGTGFIVYVLNGIQRKRIAGWGQFFDEGGSGYTLGRDVITAVLSETDGSGEKTILSPLLEKQLGESAEAHLAEFYRRGKRYIAKFASLAFTAARQGDPVAIRILETNMAFVAQKIETAKNHFTDTDQTEIPVFFSGGLSKRHDVLFPMIQKHLSDISCRLNVLNGEPIEGSVKRAISIFNEKQKGNR
ncbi:MAG: hypothetical protein IJA86_03125, partial [Clostridia bacterium]|nr:hypothetical protein [Clostridia bacterium]